MLAKIKINIINSISSAVISFLLVAGSICGFLSAFGISYNTVIALLALFLTALYLSCICRQRTFIRIIGYGGFFIAYFLGLMRFGAYVSTGFYYVLNSAADTMRLYMNVVSEQEYKLLMEPTKMAVTLMVIFIGSFVLVLANILVAEKFSLWGAIFISMPVLLIPMYIHKEPSFIWVVFLLSGYIMVMASKHIKKDSHLYSLEEKGRMKLKLCLLFFIFTAAVAVLVNIIYPNEEYQKEHEESSLKLASEEGVSTFLQFGLSGFFNSYAAKGGLSGGRLGGIYSVRPDYETDLVVRLVPYSVEPLYLRAFEGIVYSGDRWLGSEELYKLDESRIIDTSLYQETEYLAQSFLSSEEYASRAIVEVRNVGAAEEYSYEPYYTYRGLGEFTALNGGEERKETDGDRYEVYTVYPYHSLKGTEPYMSYRDYEYYTYVPEHNRTVIEEIFKEEGISGSAYEAIDKIKAYFNENFVYTMMPGKTPKNQDFVNYFLTSGNKGFCAHFASASVLMLRMLGIPARYVEGYVLTVDNMAEGMLLEDESYESYYQGYNDLGFTGVVEANINDSQAHAWVEYWDEGFGWKVAEFTPSNTSEEEYDTGIMGVLASLFGMGGEGRGSYSAGQRPEAAYEKGSLVGSLAGRISAFVRVAFLILLLWWLLMIYIRHFKCRNTKDIIRLYAYVCDSMRRKYEDFKYCDSHEAQLMFIREHIKTKELFTKEQARELSETLEYISFSREPEKAYKAACLRRNCKRVRRLEIEVYLSGFLRSRRKQPYRADIK